MPRNQRFSDVSEWHRTFSYGSTVIHTKNSTIKHGGAPHIRYGVTSLNRTYHPPLSRRAYGLPGLQPVRSHDGILTGFWLLCMIAPSQAAFAILASRMPSHWPLRFVTAKFMVISSVLSSIKLMSRNQRFSGFRLLVVDCWLSTPNVQLLWMTQLPMLAAEWSPNRNFDHFPGSYL